MSTVEKKNQSGMTLIVKVVTRLTVGLIFIFGVYVVLHGHISPGGGFAGGVIIALSFIHLVLAYGSNFASKKMDMTRAALMENIGALAFLGIAVLGMAFGWFFLNFLGKGEPFSLASAGIIPFCNIAISLKVGGGLFVIFVALTTLRLGGRK